MEGKKMIGSLEEIKFLGMAYSPVGADLKEDERWQRSTLDTEFDEEIRIHFKEYIQSLWNSNTKGRKPYLAVLRKGKVESNENSGESNENSGESNENSGESNENSGESVVQKLDSLKKLDIKSKVEDHKEFNRLAALLSSILIKTMDKRAAHGILFIIQFEVKRTTYISLLKLDLRKAGASRLNPRTHKIEYRVIRNALPEPEKLQKGAIYPVPDDPLFVYPADLLLVQTDAFAEYFNVYFNVEEVPYGRKQFNAVLDSLQYLREDRPFEKEDFQKIHEVVEENTQEILEEDFVDQLGNLIIGEAFDFQNFKKDLKKKNIEKIAIERDILADLKLKIELDSIKIQVPLNALGKVQIKGGPGNYLVCIGGSILDLKL